MKKFITAFLLCLASASVSVAQWIEVPSGTFLDLHDIWFADPGNAWIAADSSTLLHSTDAGATWSPVKLSIPFDPPIVAIEFIDADTGYALPEFGNAWVTNDGGTTWAESTEFGSDACYGTQMSFGSDAEYFLQRGCFGANGFYTRTDTGMAYELIGFPPGFELTDYLRDIEWVGPNTAIAMGDNNLVFRTKTKGSTWELLYAKDTLLDWKAVTFVSPAEGWAVTGDMFAPLYHSTDAGLTWTEDSLWMATFFYPEHRSVGASNGHVFAGGDIDWASGGLISDRTEYSFDYESVRAPVNAFHFPAPDVGYAVGDSGMILRRDSILLSTSSVAGDDQPALQTFPNPANESVTLRWVAHANRESTVILRDLSGRELIHLGWNGGEDLRLDVGMLPAGLYLVECTTEFGKVVKKVIVE